MSQLWPLNLTLKERSFLKKSPGRILAEYSAFSSMVCPFRLPLSVRQSREERRPSRGALHPRRRAILYKTSILELFHFRLALSARKQSAHRSARRLRRKALARVSLASSPFH